jgi:hypothetical protein
VSNTSIGLVSHVQIDSEHPEPTRMRIGRIAADGSPHGILIGLRLLRVHRVCVSHGQGRLYFTCSGGRVAAFAQHHSIHSAKSPL